MKPFYSVVFFAALTLGAMVHAQVGAGDDTKTIELTKDNPETLIGTTADNFTLYGLRLGMSQEEASQVLRTQDSLVAEMDTQVPAINVFKKGPGGAKGQDTLIIVNWESGARSPIITVKDRCAELLTPNFKHLLKDADAERPSAFVQKFLGSASSREVDRKYQKSGTIVQTSTYDAIGLIVKRVKSGSGNRCCFALLEAKQPPSATAQVREWMDNTDQFRIRATLVKGADDKVTLRKEDGSEVVVPLSRLSAEDRAFLKQRE